jgi:hypothetical protein
MNALQLKDGKFWLVPEALSNSIEVAVESKQLAIQIMVNSNGGLGKEIKEGELYPIEGLTYTTEPKYGNPVINGRSTFKGMVAIINK